jgi:hypothetical protein
MKIPKSFRLLGRTIRVEFRDDLVQTRDNQGEAHYRKDKIYIQSSVEGFPRSKEQIEATFCHELVHFILSAMEEEKLGQDERFAALFGGLLHQALNSFSSEE